MKATLLALLGLLLGAVMGGMVGAMAGFGWAGLQSDCADGSCGLVVFATTPAGMLVGGLGGAWLLARKAFRNRSA